eukprot:scaffold3936_cov128-Isochrysis_galbana.AAC.10
MAPRRPGTQPTEADPTLDIGAKRARVEGEDESSTQVRLRARTRACKCACTCHAHTLAWLLLWLSVRRGSSLPQRDVSAAKTPLGVAASPFNTSASAGQYLAQYTVHRPRQNPTTQTERIRQRHTEWIPEAGPTQDNHRRERPVGSHWEP